MKQIKLKCYAIVAMAKNRVIGGKNQLLWHLPKDLQRFKALTTGHPIIMGRKTYESIGKPLPNRTNIILTRDAGFAAPGCVIAHDSAQALRYAGEVDHEIFIIGGAEIYRQFLPHLDGVYLTLVDAEIEGDTYFPELNPADWLEISRESYEADDKHMYDYQFIELVRR